MHRMAPLGAWEVPLGIPWVCGGSAVVAKAIPAHWDTFREAPRIPKAVGAETDFPHSNLPGCTASNWGCLDPARLPTPREATWRVRQKMERGQNWLDPWAYHTWPCLQYSTEVNSACNGSTTFCSKQTFQKLWSQRIPFFQTYDFTRCNTHPPSIHPPGVSSSVEPD